MSMTVGYIAGQIEIFNCYEINSISVNQIEIRLIKPSLIYGLTASMRNLSSRFVCSYRTSAEQFPIIVSQDCGHTATANVIQSYGIKLTHIEVSCLLRMFVNLCVCLSMHLKFHFGFILYVIHVSILKEKISISVCVSFS